jgi:hypothetical protein
LLAALPLTAWAGKPDIANMLAHARTVVIVPLESPPLYFDPPGVALIAAKALNVQGVGEDSNGMPLITVAGPAVTIASAAVGSIIASKSAKANTQLTMDIVDALSVKGTWVAPRIVAGIVAAELGKRGVTTTRIRDGLEPIPGVTDRQVTLLGLNWATPISHWYDSRQTPFAYGAPDVEANDLVLEVCLFAYGYGRIGVEADVMVKLVAAESGTVVAKGMAKRYQSSQRADQDFANSGEAFKAHFTALAQQATENALKKMGL